MKKTLKVLAGKKLVDLVVKSAQEKLAENIVVIDHRKSASTADYFVICESSTTVQNQAIAGEIIAACKDAGTSPWHHEGSEDGRWVLIDFSDVVVHIMLSELRSYYKLEELWETGVRQEVTK